LIGIAGCAKAIAGWGRPGYDTEPALLDLLRQKPTLLEILPCLCTRIGRQLVMVLLELFGGLALLMTAIGVYGVISYTVAERTREIGIRAALGARPADILRLVIGGGLTVVCSGLVAGLVLAFAASRFLESSLYSVSTTDPATFAFVAAVLLVVALTAQVIPIVRAMHIDPTIALRQD
jgi:putative ABC transport system permease protein